MSEKHRQTEREHGELRAILSEIDAAKTDAALDAMIARLQSMLPPHFEAEERAGGLFADALARHPEAANAISERVREHRTFTDALAKLSGEGRRERMLALCAALGTHERHEAELLAEIAYRETGALD